VDVHVGSRRFTTSAELVSAGASVAVLRFYADRNPFALGTIRKETGISCETEPGGLSAVARHSPAVALRP
jgi:hypothetical protein